MAIKFGMTVADMIMQLTKGFIKATGRKPEALEKIKIQQEAVQRFKDMNKVVDMEGKTIDTSKGIMGGKEMKAMGGRIGLKDGMDRRGFLKLMGGLAALPVLGKFFKVGKVASKAAPGITTPPLPNKPEWFDALVNKVITMGEDVTKKFGFKERQTVHKLDIDEFEDVMVYRDADAGEIRVTYESPNNTGESSIDLVYKKELPDEGNPNPSPEFYAVEPEPRVVNRDGDMEFDGENLVDSVDELMSDTTKLKEIATGKKKTLGEFVKSKKKKDEVKSLNENPIEQAEYIESKYGPGPEPDFDDIENFASGGIARMLGE